MKHEGFRHIDTHGPAEDITFGQISSIAQIVNTTSKQIGNFLVNGHLYVYGGNMLMQEINYADPYRTIHINPSFITHFSLGVNEQLKRRKEYLFTPEELKIVLDLPEVPLSSDDIDNQLDKVLHEKYSDYFRLYVTLNHDIHHLLISNKHSKLLDGTTYMRQTQELLDKLFIMHPISYITMRNLVAAFKDTIREEFLSGFIIKKVYDKNAIIRLHNLILDDLEKFVRRADEDIEKVHKTVASQEYDEFALTVDVMLEKGIEHTKKTVELLTLCEGNKDWRKFLIEQLFDYDDEEKQEWLTQKETLLPFNEIVPELAEKDADTVRQKHCLTKGVLDFIYRINRRSLLHKNPHEDEILYAGKVDVAFPPLFEDSKEGVNNYIVFQAAVESICKNEFERYKKIAEETPLLS